MKRKRWQTLTPPVTGPGPGGPGPSSGPRWPVQFDPGFEFGNCEAQAADSDLTQSSQKHRHRVGSYAWATQVSSERALQAPTSLHDLLGWPEAYMVAVCGQDGWMARLQENLKNGASFRSDYTGIGFVRESLRQLDKELKKYIVRPGPPISTSNPIVTFQRACDSGPLQHKLLVQCAHEIDGGASCVFKAIEERIPKHVSEELSKCLPNASCQSSRKWELGYRKQLAYLLENGKAAFPVDAKSYCSTHERLCPVRPPLLYGPSYDTKPHLATEETEREKRQLQMAEGSTTCVGWSSMNGTPSFKRFSHESERCHNCWLGERKEFASDDCEDVFFHECTQNYPSSEKLSEPLQGSHQVLSMKLSPHMLGRPVTRTRMLSAGLNLKSMRWVGPASNVEIAHDFMRVFGRHLQLDGDVFLCSSDEAVEADYQEMALNRKTTIASGYWKNGLLANIHVMPPHVAQTLIDYMPHRQELMGPSGALLADLHQSYTRGKTGFSGPLFPPMLTHGGVVSFSQDRFVTGDEYLAVQGINMWQSQDQPLGSVLRDILAPLPRSKKILVAGNGVCTATFGAWFLYVMSNVRRVTDARAMADQSLLAPPAEELECAESAEMKAADVLDVDCEPQGGATAADPAESSSLELPEDSPVAVQSDDLDSAEADSPLSAAGAIDDDEAMRAEGIEEVVF